MIRKTITLVIIIMTMSGCVDTPVLEKEEVYSNKISDDRMLLVLSAPSINDSYYAPIFQIIVDFQIKYANAILGNDNVVIIVDRDTKAYYENELPEDLLIIDEIHDIWARDFSTVNPLEPVQFVYTWASMTKQESESVQKSFDDFANRYQIQRQYANFLLDGGNIVDNYAGRVITTSRFMEDNHLSYEEAKQLLQERIGATEVAILEPDEEVLAHADGMVSWIDENTLLVNDYSDDELFRAIVMDELQSAFPDVKIIEVPVEYQNNRPGEWEGFESACGVNLNSTVTFKNIYVPVFNMQHDQEVINIIKRNSTKTVIPVDASGVCAMGGSVRCLTWQLTGENAEKLILAARKK
ncbi:MAG: hypothetical protein D6675_09695 [Gemmatimonadetes bacterium]|nr:MAG: hypothetical protein D6675_09695 [Gemmatimonadota bacterium]